MGTTTSTTTTSTTTTSTTTTTTTGACIATGVVCWDSTGPVGSATCCGTGGGENSPCPFNPMNQLSLICVLASDWFILQADHNIDQSQVLLHKLNVIVLSSEAH